MAWFLQKIVLCMPQMSRSTEKLRENARKFLNDIPKLPSHYCRASSSKLYLETHFRSLADVYKLLKEKNSENAASRQIFADEFHKMNIALFMTKKDQCDKCCAFKTGNLSEAEYEEHVNTLIEMPHGNVMEIFHEFSMGFCPYEITMACPWNTHGVHSMGIPWTIHGDFIWAKTHGKPMVSTPWVFHGQSMVISYGQKTMENP